MEVRVLGGFAIFVMLCPAHSVEVGPPLGYTLTFDEEFNGLLSVSDWGESPARWMAHTPDASDFGDAYFTGFDEPDTPSPFKLENGILTVAAYRDPNADYHWRSGLLASVDTAGNGFSQALGYFEIRMKLPAGTGVWPAFWLAGINGVQSPPVPGLKSAEIDILEEYGDDPTSAYQTVHVWNPDGREAYGIGNWCYKYGMTSDYHTYAALVNLDYIYFYIDGVEQWKTPTPPEATGPLYVMVDLALGGGQSTDDTPDPSQLSVDYIRVYAPPAVADGYNLFPSEVPAGQYNDGVRYELGTQFHSSYAGHITGLRFYKPSSGSGDYVLHIWNGSGDLVATQDLGIYGTNTYGWITVNVSPIPLDANYDTTVAVELPSDSWYYASSPNALPIVSHPPLAAVQGRYGRAGSYPTNISSNNYFVDIVYTVP